jgi:peptidoglycan hydrolase-like protein with peptidoglycan-binding domain
MWGMGVCGLRGRGASKLIALAACVTLPLVSSACASVSTPAAKASAPTTTLPVHSPFAPPVTSPVAIVPSTTTTTTLPPRQVTVVPVAPLPEPLPAVGSADGEGTRRIQQRLLDLGFWLQRVNGDYGVTTSQAVMAFQKWAGLPPTAEVDEATATALSTATAKAHGSATDGDLIEVDKDRQLLFILDEGVTIWTINISTGSGIPFRERDKTEWGKWIEGDAVTPDGVFTINREVEKGWRTGDLGDIYRPKYFNYGIALHGAYKVPNHPASHGCVRMSTPAMDFLWAADLAPLGTVVWVHSTPPPA